VAATQPKTVTPPAPAPDSTLRHLVTATLFTAVSVVLLGLIYPLVVWLLATVLFHNQAAGSLIEDNGKLIGSSLVGQLFTKPQYFHGRPSAAGKGYDPTQTGGTNLGPTSKKLISTTRDAVAALRKENPEALGPIPPDLVTSSGSGIDPDISPDAAFFQVARVAKARALPVERVRALVESQIIPRQFGIFGEPRVNVLALNRALDAQSDIKK
jgi:K+-transporting ATPase ATPase C chain